MLLKNLAFANGVLLSDDESFVIVLECLTSRIVKYNLKGPKAGQKEIFAEALPGLPDNVHSDGNGGFIVSLLLYIDGENPFLPQSLTQHQNIRKMFSRLLVLIEAPFKLLEDIYPNYYSKRVLHTVGSFETSQFLDMKKASVVLRFDKTGKVLDALYSDDEKVHTISSAYVHNGYLWLGSPWNEYVKRVPLKQAFPDLPIEQKPSIKKEQKAEEPLITVSGTPNIKVEAKTVNAKPAAQQPTTKSAPKPPVKAQTATQKPQSDAATAKPSTTTVKPTSQQTTTTPKPTSSAPSKTPANEIKKDSTMEVKEDNLKVVKKDTSKQIKKENVKEVKKDNVKQVKKDNSKEIKDNNSKETKKDNSKELKKDNSNVNSKPQVTKKGSEETVKPKSEESVKKSASQAANAKPVEKKVQPNKK